MNRDKIIKEIYDWAITRTNNVVLRNLAKNCNELIEFDKIDNIDKKDTKRMTISWKQHIVCYGCGKTIKRPHYDYVYSCHQCGETFKKGRQLLCDLTGKIAVVIGGRTKLGHQIIMKLIRAGSTVIGTTRYPEKAMNLFSSYADYSEWSSRLFFYPYSFDLDTNNLNECCKELQLYIESNFGKLDILVNSAAQTIRTKEKDTISIIEENRYSDTKYVPDSNENSWGLLLDEVSQKEFEEVYRINCLGPTFITKHLIHLLKKAEDVPYIINVHAREGLLNVKKSDKHCHTNMAKAGLTMLTKQLISMNLESDKGIQFSIHGCDPGWFSVDEYYKDSSPWIVPPLDEIDGASRIVYPIFTHIKYSSWKTRRHYHLFNY